MIVGFGKWLFIIFMLVAAIAATAVMSPVYTFAFIPVICFGVILVGNPRIYIYIYLSVASVYPLIQSITAFAPFQYLNEIMAVVLYAMFFGHLVFRRLNLSGIHKFFRLCFLFFGYCLLIWLVNRGIPKGLMQFFFIYLPFIPLFFMVREYFTDRDFGILLKWTIGFFWINFILNLGWWFHINPLPNQFTVMGNMFDHATGTIGGCNYIAYFCGMFIFLIIAALLKPDLFTRRQRRFMSFTLISVFIQLYMTFTNHAYIFFILALVPFVYLTRLWKKWYAVAGLIVGIGLFLLVASQSEMASYALDANELQYRYEQLRFSPKIQIYNDLLLENFHDNPAEWLVGVGPGNGMGHIGMDNYTDFAVRMLLEYYQAADMSQMQMSSITGHTYSAVFSIWGDLGLIGFILFIAIHILPLSYCYKKIKTGAGIDVVVGQFLICSFILWAILCLVIDAMQTILPIWLWLWMGWLLRKEKTSTAEEIPVKESEQIDAV